MVPAKRWWSRTHPLFSKMYSKNVILSFSLSICDVSHCAIMNHQKRFIISETSRIKRVIRPFWWWHSDIWEEKTFLIFPSSISCTPHITTIQLSDFEGALNFMFLKCHQNCRCKIWYWIFEEVHFSKHNFGTSCKHLNSRACWREVKIPNQYGGGVI